MRDILKGTRAGKREYLKNTHFPLLFHDGSYYRESVFYRIDGTPDLKHHVRILASKMGNGSSEPLYIVMSTEHLLENLITQSKFEESYFCIDSTYKFNKQRYPLMVKGTQDRAHRFDLGRFCISSHEDCSAYEFFTRVYVRLY